MRRVQLAGMQGPWSWSWAGLGGLAEQAPCSGGSGCSVPRLSALAWAARGRRAARLGRRAAHFPHRRLPATAPAPALPARRWSTRTAGPRSACCPPSSTRSSGSRRATSSTSRPRRWAGPPAAAGGRSWALAECSAASPCLPHRPPAVPIANQVNASPLGAGRGRQPRDGPDCARAV